MFLTLPLDGGEWSALCSNCFTIEERPQYPLGLKIDLDMVVKRKKNCCWELIPGLLY
jgi:hypothetical protein